MSNPLEGFMVLAQYGLPQERFGHALSDGHNVQNITFYISTGQPVSTQQFVQRGNPNAIDWWPSKQVPTPTPVVGQTQTGKVVTNQSVEQQTSIPKVLENARFAAINIAKQNAKNYYEVTKQRLDLTKLVINEFLSNGIYYIQVGLYMPYDQMKTPGRL